MQWLLVLHVAMFVIAIVSELAKDRFAIWSRPKPR
jgi:hypothetical protein